MKCHILLEDRTGSNDPNYNNNGNVCSTICMVQQRNPPGWRRMNVIMEAGADKRRVAAPASIPYRVAAQTRGAIGYVNTAMELVAQAGARLSFDGIVHATGAGTQASIITGLRTMTANIPLLGIGVRAPKPKQEANVLALAKATADRIGCPVSSGRRMSSPIATVGEPASRQRAALRPSACCRAGELLLDPVYSAKAAAGLIDLIRKGKFSAGQRVLFWHTGAVALFKLPTRR